jgi:beta-lactamase superfamily II metal-dependent hydrolase
LAALSACTALVVAQGPPAKQLRVYIIDVEGGNAQLWVTPSGESVVIDTGNGYSAENRGKSDAATRDADRIMAAVRDAGIARIDHLITTHFHGDHFGALIELVSRIPVRNFIDHGPIVQQSPQSDAFYAQYIELAAKARRTVPKPGDRLPVSGLEWRIVNSHGQTIKTPLSNTPGAGASNPHCSTFVKHDQNPVLGAKDYGQTEDEQVVASHVTFGSFRTLFLADFDWNQEPALVCPNNLLGTVDLFIVSRHGQPSSNSQALVHAIQPRVAIMNNGLRKGGQPSVMKILFESPRLEGLWQMHAATLGGQEYTVAGLFIANLDETSIPVAPVVLPPPGSKPLGPAPVHDGPAGYFKVTAGQDGTFTVTNSRNGFSKTYGRVNGASLSP